MAKALLLGAALFGCLVVVHSDPVCNATIERPLMIAVDRIGLYCSVTGNVTSITWTRDGYTVPVPQTHSESQLLEVPLKEAKGLFECHVQCGETSQSASIRLDSSDSPSSFVFQATNVAFVQDCDASTWANYFGNEDHDIVRALPVLLFIGFVFLFLLSISCSYRLCQRRRKRANQRSRRSSQRDLAVDLRMNDPVMVMMALPNVARVA